MTDTCDHCESAAEIGTHVLNKGEWVSKSYCCDCYRPNRVVYQGGIANE